MELKEKIKQEIDSIPEEFLPQIEEYIRLIKNKNVNKKPFKTLHLKGKFDNINIRKLVYE